MMKNISYIKANIGQCAGTDGCQFAPSAIVESLPEIQNKVSHSLDSYGTGRGINALPMLIDFSTQLSTAVKEVLALGNFPIVLGGDHSCGIGTWSGAVAPDEDFGLIWVDAHFDLHTLDSSDSKNMHGMPTATLLGHGDDTLKNIHFAGAKIKPENMVYIGIRCFESPEQKLAESLDLKVYYADDVHAKTFKGCLEETVKFFQAKGIDFGISFDMDSLDITEMTALGTPVENGLVLADVQDAFNTVDMTGLRLLEVVEYNPTLDETGNDVIPVQKVLACFDGDIKL